MKRSLICFASKFVCILPLTNIDKSRYLVNHQEKMREKGRGEYTSNALIVVAIRD